MRVLVVEDEKTPRETLRDLVPWATHGFTAVDTARNGVEALAILEATGADLVVTDIRMPKMDGVELALQVHERWPATALVFLSGYSDKEYLKTAIRVQALDYLDKPIDLEQVEAVAARAAQVLRAGRSLEGLGPLRRQALAQALLVATAASGPWEDRFARGPLRAFVLDPGPGADPGWRARALEVVNADHAPQRSLVAAPSGPRSVAVFGDRNLEPGTDLESVLSPLLEALDRLDPDVRVRVGLAPSVASPDRLGPALLDAEAALADSYYRPDQRVFPVRPPSDRVFELPLEAPAAWRASLGRKDAAAVLRQLETLEQRAAAIRDPNLDRVVQTWSAALSICLEFVPGWGPVERKARLDRLGVELASAPSSEAAARVARDCFSRLFLVRPEDLAVADRVQRARNFIEAQYPDPDLTVDSVAAHVGYSESYFCTVFKQALGVTVKDYVTQVRIDRAKAYLWESDPRSMADLALRVGFRDPNYFSTVFRRVTGTTPGAYRKKALG